jgi:hypothetical protein
LNYLGQHSLQRLYVCIELSLLRSQVVVDQRRAQNDVRSVGSVQHLCEEVETGIPKSHRDGSPIFQKFDFSVCNVNSKQKEKDASGHYLLADGQHVSWRLLLHMIL